MQLLTSTPATIALSAVLALAAVALLYTMRARLRAVLGLVLTAALAVTAPAVLHTTTATATTPPGQDFDITESDLDFILDQITISEHHAEDVVHEDPDTSPLCTDRATFDVPTQTWTEMDGDHCVGAKTLPFGLRTVDGSWNNLNEDRTGWGAGLETFPRLLEPEFNGADPIPPGGAPGGPPGTPTSYEQTQGFVYDAEPRIISNLIADQTTNNPAAVAAAERIDGSKLLDDAETNRIAGENRYHTATELSASHFGSNVPVVYFATGKAFPDALAGVPAAAADNAPILLVRDGKLPAETIAELERLNPQKIVILGGEAAVSKTTEAKLAEYTTGPVERLAGRKRYETAAKISEATFGPDVSTIYVATGQNFPDALAGGAASARAGAPTLLVRSDKIPDPTRAELERLDPDKILVLGGAEAVTEDVEDELAQFTDGEVVRLAGEDRYETAIAISNYHQSDEVGKLYMAVGNNFPDALTGGVVAGLNTTPLLLARGEGELKQPLTTELQRLSPSQVHLLGGDTAIGEDMANQIAQEVRGTNIFIPDVATDEGLSASITSFTTIFGQFFDHGLDLVSKGGNGTVVVPLQPDDPLYDPESHTNFLMLTRATIADGEGREHINRTTPYVDQNQTYTSHSSHQVFIREYAQQGGVPVPTGHLLDGSDGGLVTWGELKVHVADNLGIQLSDSDVLDVPLLRTDPYGRFVPGDNGLPQIATEGGFVEGNLANPVEVPENAHRAGHAFLDDIAHGAAPDPDAPPDAPPGYDNAALEAHYITGDGRGNENIGLTAVHAVFHSEHNRVAEQIDEILHLEGNEELLAGYQADGYWDYGERLFQAARFITEMEYQHLVFEEFGRRIAPSIDATILNENSYYPDVNSAIVAEFAHVVYRFGHSLLTENVDRQFGDQIQELPLFDAFLNPEAYATGPNGERLTPEEAAGSTILGMTHQTSNAIDEFTTDTLRNQLLGLPLDLATINLARGRETGVPPLQAARQSFYDASGHEPALKPYANWQQFELRMKNPESIVNFVAAYGIHPTLDAAQTVDQMRAAAQVLVTDDAFMTAPAAETGVDDIDFWIGGLAETPSTFGNMLGSTFNYVFEKQMEDLQNGDRFYYLTRNHGESLFHGLESNSFSELIQRNTSIDAIPFDVFSAPDQVYDLNDPAAALQEQGLLQEPDGTWRYAGEEHVVMHGTDAAESMRSGNGDDTIWGRGGDDRIEGNEGVDSLHGGDGDDIITDIHGDGDTILGGAGNDAINPGPGFDDLVLSGTGKDFVVGGQDRLHVFAGGGDDFIQGAPGPDTLYANEGDDWVEGGLGHDLLQGDNGNGYFNDPNGGHDVMLGGPGNQDYDAEGGDDIMLGGEGTERFHGMLGFDWVSYHDTTRSMQADMAFGPHMPDDLNNIRDRYWLVEALSGSPQNDILRGTQQEDDAMDPTGGKIGYGHRMTQEHLGRIDGLRVLLGGGDRPVYAVPLLESETPYDGDQNNNIILAGSGSDIVEARDGRNFVDGDAYLNVRIEWRPEGGPVESGDTMAAFHTRVFDGTINPADLHIVREILQTENEDGVLDTAVYSGIDEDYTVTELDDGNWEVANIAEAPEMLDVLRHVERLQFNDQIVCLIPEASEADCGMPTGSVTLSTNEPVEDVEFTTTFDITDPNGTEDSEFVFELQTFQEVGLDGFTNHWVTTQANTTGAFTPGDAEVGFPVRVVVSYTDDSGTQEFLASEMTSPVVNVNDSPEPQVIAPAEPMVGSLMWIHTQLSDPDGDENVVEDGLVDYQWESAPAGTPGDASGWTEIAGATGDTYVVEPEQEGRILRLVARYDDDRGTAEVSRSAATEPVLPGTGPSATSTSGAGRMLSPQEAVSTQ